MITLQNYRPYIPKTPGELIDQLGGMMLDAPTFVDKSGYFPRNLETEFSAVAQGLEAIRKRIGEEKYRTLRDMSDRMRALFEADPEDVTGETLQGRMLIDEMQQILMNRPKPG